MNNDYVEQIQWDQNYKNLQLFVAPGSDPMRLWIEANIPAGAGSCLELGCFPGRYLAVFGEMGYELHGVDLTPRTVTDLPQWLAQKGHKTGQFVTENVFTFDPQRNYDVVCSFGLIEHFHDWELLFKRHADMVKPGGYLAISTPNFKSHMQNALHRYLDQDNLALHNVGAMVPDRWSQIALDCGFEIICCGGIGRFDFWAPSQRRNLLQLALLRVIGLTRFLWDLFPEGTMAFAPYYGIVARRRSL